MVFYAIIFHPNYITCWKVEKKNRIRLWISIKKNQFPFVVWVSSSHLTTIQMYFWDTYKNKSDCISKITDVNTNSFIVLYALFKATHLRRTFRILSSFVHSITCALLAPASYSFPIVLQRKRSSSSRWMKATRKKRTTNTKTISKTFFGWF